MGTISFADFAEANPKVSLKKDEVFPFVDMAAVTPGQRYVKASEERPFKGGSSKFQTGDTLFARITPCLENGKIAQFIGATDDTVGFGSTEFFVFRARDGVSDSAYLYYLCQTDELRKPAEKSMAGASGRQRADLNSVLTVEVSCPPLSTQRKIASILSAYDDLIENNTRRIAILEEMAQAIYREWFVNFRFPGHENVKLVQSTLGMIPEGWKATTVGDLAVNERRSVNPQEVDSETPYVGLEHIPRKSITLSEWGLASEIESTKHRFFEGEILFGKIRPYFHKVVVAPFDGICSSDAIVIVPRDHDYFPALLCCVSSVPFVDHATQTSQGTKMPRANWDVLTKYSSPLPPSDLLRRFNEVVTDIVCTLKTLMLKNVNLRTTRDLLLPKLISGQLDVEELEIDLGMTSEALEEATG